MLSIIIPAGRNVAALKQTLHSIGKAKSDAREIIIPDSTGYDEVEASAKDYGAVFLHCAENRGVQKAKAATIAKGEWLLFLHPGSQLQKGGMEELQRFMKPANKRHATVFCYALDDANPMARQLEAIYRWGNKVMCASGAQGLCLHRELYDRLGGFKPYPAFEDVDITRQLLKHKGSELRVLPVDILVPADYFSTHGYMRGAIWRLSALYFYVLGLPVNWAAAVIDEK